MFYACYKIHSEKLHFKFLSYNNLLAATKQTLKGTSSHIQNFGCWQERFNVYVLEIVKQFLLCYNKSNNHKVW